LQGGERDATDLFNELIRGSIRQAFGQMMSDEGEALSGPHYWPHSENDYRRAGSERGRAYLDGEKEDIVRPLVRHEENGEVPLES